MPSAVELIVPLIILGAVVVLIVIKIALPDPPPDGCRSCGFLLTGSPGPTCPECGSTAGRWGPAGRAARRRLAMRFVWLFAGFLLVSFVVSAFEQYFPYLGSYEYRGEVRPHGIEFRGHASAWGVPAREVESPSTEPEPRVVEIEFEERVVRLRRGSRSDDTLVFFDAAGAATGAQIVDRLDPDRRWSGAERREIVAAVDIVLTHAWGDHRLNDAIDPFQLRPGQAHAMLIQTAGGEIVDTLHITRIALLAATLLIAVWMVLRTRSSLRSADPTLVSAR